MKILKNQVFNLYDSFANVSRTFKAKQDFDLSSVLANGLYQYDFAHNFYSNSKYMTMTEEGIVLDWLKLKKFQILKL